MLLGVATVLMNQYKNRYVMVACSEASAAWLDGTGQDPQ
jgi:hypothetical protein